MTTVASRDLRDHTAEILRQVSGGARVTITVNGKPVAEIAPVRATRSQFFAKADLVALIVEHQADSGLTSDLDELAGDPCSSPVDSRSGHRRRSATDHG